MACKTVCHLRLIPRMVFNFFKGVSSFSLHKTYVQWPERPVKNNADEHTKCSTAFPWNKTGLWYGSTRVKRALVLVKIMENSCPLKELWG